MTSLVAAEIDAHSRTEHGHCAARRNPRRACSALSPGSTETERASYDFQTFYASDLCRNAKALYYRKPLLGTVAVAPIIFCEAFVPSARSLFWKRQRFPIADAHYAMGFAHFGQVFE